MAVAVVATPGAPTANSFTELAVFLAYCNDRLNASVALVASTDNQARALLEATRDLNALSWDGEPSNDTQALAWPRQYACNPDDPTRRYFEPTVIPQRVIDATCELAFQYLRAGTTDLASPDAKEGVIRKKIGPIETEWASPRERRSGLKRFDRVWNRIAVLLEDAGGGIQLVRG